MPSLSVSFDSYKLQTACIVLSASEMNQFYVWMFKFKFKTIYYCATSFAWHVW